LQLGWANKKEKKKTSIEIVVANVFQRRFESK
jgi:hypothetical protein